MTISDSYYDKVTTLCNFEGSNNSTTILNDINLKPLTVVGTGKLSNTQVKFGSTSFAGLSAYTTSIWVPFINQASDFTIEFFYYNTSTTYSEILTLSSSTSSSLRNLNIQLNGTGKLNFTGNSTFGGGGAGFSLVGTTTVTNNVWHFYTVTKSGTTVKLYYDGNLELTGTLTSTDLPSYILVFGKYYTYELNGYLDSFRVTQGGIVRYTSNFTPPTQAFPSYPKFFGIWINRFLSSIIAHYQLAESSGTTLADSVGSYPLTISGGTPSFFQSPLPSWSDDYSIQFSGQTSTSGIFASFNAFSSLSFVFFLKTTTNSQTILSKSGVFSIGLNSSGFLTFTISGNTLTSSISFTDNVIRFISVTFQTFRLSICYNGVLDSFLNGTFSITDAATQPLVIGPLTGTLDEVSVLSKSISYKENQELYNWAFSINPPTYNKTNYPIIINDSNLTYPRKNVKTPLNSIIDTRYSCYLLSDSTYQKQPYVLIDGYITLHGVPAKRKVFLLEKYNKFITRVVWSDSLGYFSFNDIKKDYYQLICEDYETSKGALKDVVIGVSTNLDPLAGSIVTSSINQQFVGYMSQSGIFKVPSVDQTLIDNLFYSSNVLGSYKIEGVTYINLVVTGFVNVLLLDSSYKKISTTQSDASGNYSFQNLHYDAYYVLTIENSLKNVIIGPILPDSM